MSPVSQEETLGWVELAKERIALRQASIDSGTADQATWEGWSRWQLFLGRALFLHGAPLAEVEEAFRRAAQAVTRVFQMSYDKSSPYYLGSQADPASVTDTSAIDGLNAALMAGDLELARQLAQWIPQESTDPTTPMELHHYTRGLQYTVLDKLAEAAPHVEKVLKKHKDKPPKPGYPRNYFTLALALSGIVTGSDAQLNEGLSQQAAFYEALAKGENMDTPEEHFCDHLAALSNLGLLRGRHVNEELPFLPKRLLVGVEESR